MQYYSQHSFGIILSCNTYISYSYLRYNSLLNNNSRRINTKHGDYYSYYKYSNILSDYFFYRFLINFTKPKLQTKTIRYRKISKMNINGFSRDFS